MDHGTVNAYQNYSCRCQRCRTAWAKDQRGRRMRPQPVLVYFIQVEDGPVKIGVATDIGRRLRMLQTGNHRELTVLGTIPGGHTLEHELHKRLAPHRLRGEWFEAAPAKLALAEETKCVDEREADRHTRASPLMASCCPNCGTASKGVCGACVEFEQARQEDDPFA